MKTSFCTIARSLGKFLTQGESKVSDKYEPRHRLFGQGSSAGRSIIYAIRQCAADMERGGKVDDSALRRAIKEVRSSLRHMSGPFRPGQADYLLETIDEMRRTALEHNAGRGRTIARIDKLNDMLSAHCPDKTAPGWASFEMPSRAGHVRRNMHVANPRAASGDSRASFDTPPRAAQEAGDVCLARRDTEAEGG